VRERERGEERLEQRGNIQTPFLKLSIATQCDLNGDGRGPIREGGPNRRHALFFSPHLVFPPHCPFETGLNLTPTETEFNLVLLSISCF